jgi:cyclophilin family peptidyl-prolyl cis-trans isomerase
MAHSDLFAHFKTNQGDFKVQLFADKAPRTVSNFVNLSREGFYNGLIFHRVIEGFMIQGGDPLGKGTGGPNYRFKDEFHPDLRHRKIGTLSMANAGPNTNGSQFFITLAPTPHLDDRHAVFGEVVEGMDTVQTIGSTATGSMDRPKKDQVIESIEIIGDFEPVDIGKVES